jgi:hypothetical protein
MPTPAVKIGEPLRKKTSIKLRVDLWRAAKIQAMDEQRGLQESLRQPWSCTSRPPRSEEIVTKGDLWDLWRRVSDRPAVEQVGFDGWIRKAARSSARPAYAYPDK